MRHRNTWATAVLPATQRDVLRHWGWPADSLPLIHKLRCCNYHERSQVPKLWTNISLNSSQRSPEDDGRSMSARQGWVHKLEINFLRSAQFHNCSTHSSGGCIFHSILKVALSQKQFMEFCWQRNIKAKVSLSFHNSVFFPCNLLRIQQPEQLLPLMASYNYG